MATVTVVGLSGEQREVVPNIICRNIYIYIVYPLKVGNDNFPITSTFSHIGLLSSQVPLSSYLLYIYIYIQVSRYLLHQLNITKR
jgi:hypothetical protein